MSNAFVFGNGEIQRWPVNSDLSIWSSRVDNDCLLPPNDDDINSEPDGKGKDEEVLEKDDHDGKPVDGGIATSRSKVLRKEVQPVFKGGKFNFLESYICNYT